MSKLQRIIYNDHILQSSQYCKQVVWGSAAHMWSLKYNIEGKLSCFLSSHTCASWILIGFPLAFASDNFPFQTLLSPLYSYLLSRKLKQQKRETINLKAEKMWVMIYHSDLIWMTTKQLALVKVDFKSRSLKEIAILLVLLAYTIKQNKEVANSYLRTVST